MAKIVFVEDDEYIFELIGETLSSNNYEIKGYKEPISFLNEVESLEADLIMLDLMLPYKNGYEVLTELKNNSKTCNIPVIIVSARNQEDDIVKGLDDGACDYITKPFGLKELISRVNSNLRKTISSTTSLLKIRDLVLNENTFKATVCNHELQLTKKEFQTLSILMKNKGSVVERKELLKQVWNIECYIETRTLDMHIKSIRQKIAEFSNEEYVETVRGVGFIIK